MEITWHKHINTRDGVFFSFLFSFFCVCILNVFGILAGTETGFNRYTCDINLFIEKIKHDISMILIYSHYWERTIKHKFYRNHLLFFPFRQIMLLLILSCMIFRKKIPLSASFIEIVPFWSCAGSIVLLKFCFVSNIHSKWG